ncbi:MAG: hypothetical protein ABI300_09710 [Rhodanobacter sp.]
MNGLIVTGAKVRGADVPAAATRRNGKWVVLGVALAAALVLPLGASARGHDYRGGYSGGYSGGSYGNYGYARGNYGHGYYNRGYDRGYDRGYGSRYSNRGGHWSGGNWIAGAIVAGAVVGLINSASRPVYYDRPVVYSQPRVVYDTYYPAPVVTRRVVETRTVYQDPYQTRYIRGDGDDD